MIKPCCTPGVDLICTRFGFTCLLVCVISISLQNPTLWYEKCSVFHFHFVDIFTLFERKRLLFLVCCFTHYNRIICFWMDGSDGWLRWMDEFYFYILSLNSFPLQCIPLCKNINFLRYFLMIDISSASLFWFRIGKIRMWSNVFLKTGFYFSLFLIATEIKRMKWMFVQTKPPTHQACISMLHDWRNLNLLVSSTKEKVWNWIKFIRSAFFAFESRPWIIFLLLVTVKYMYAVDKTREFQLSLPMPKNIYT